MRTSMVGTSKQIQKPEKRDLQTFKTPLAMIPILMILWTLYLYRRPIMRATGRQRHAKRIQQEDTPPSQIVPQINWMQIEAQAQQLRIMNIKRYEEKERRDEPMKRTYLLWELIVDTILYRFYNAEANKFENQETFDKAINVAITQFKQWGTITGEEDLARLSDRSNSDVCFDLGIANLPTEMRPRPLTPLYNTISAFLYKNSGLALLKEPYTKMHSFSDFLRTNSLISHAQQSMEEYYRSSSQVDPDAIYLKTGGSSFESSLFIDEEVSRCHSTHFSTINLHLTDKKALIRSIERAFRLGSRDIHPDRTSDPALRSRFVDMNHCSEILVSYINRKS